MAYPAFFKELPPLLLVARKLITLSWLKPLPPTLQQWREGLKKVYVMETITAKPHVKIDLFLALWAPIISHFGWPDR